MPFFKRASDGRIVFTDFSKKHAGKTVEEVAREDPGYLRWARTSRTGGLDPDIFDEIDDAMRTNGVPFTKPRRKSSPPKRS